MNAMTVKVTFGEDEENTTVPESEFKARRYRGAMLP
jgi:hypothetical protein